MVVNITIILLVLTLCAAVKSQVCPKQCDCDMENGLNRALCVDQSIVNINVGVPKEVQVYSLSRNAISELENFCFRESGYTSITILNLSYNIIFWIGLNAFSGLEHLTHLDLSYNRLRYIPSDLFMDTPKLESLDLSGNVFETLKNEPFLMHNNLQVLNLNNCRIKALADRLFTRLPNLRKLDLSENYMITLNTQVLKPLRRLQRLEIHNEYWQCNEDFKALESWISLRGITYEKQCRNLSQKMSEKMISIAPEERHDVDLRNVWNMTKSGNMTLPVTSKPLTPFEKFDQEFPSFQAFIIGLEVGLAIGILGTFLWLKSLCKCGHLNCRRPKTRRERRREQRAMESDMRSTLLWSNIGSEMETPPSFRRQLSLPDRSPPFPVYGLPGLMRQVSSGASDERTETPPPPYQECRINL